MLVVFAALFAWTAYRAGGIKHALAYYRRNAEYKDWLPLLYIPALIMLVLSLPARAEPVTYLDYTSVHAGIEVPIGSGASVFCRPQSDSIDDRVSSNLGITQHLVGWHDIDVVAAYTHHSCAIDKDQNLWDGVGLHVRWTHYW